VELDAFERVVAVADTHDFVVVFRLGGGRQCSGNVSRQQPTHSLGTVSWEAESARDRGGATFTLTIEGASSVSTIKVAVSGPVPGANLKVAGISSLAAGDTTFENAVVANTSTIGSSFVEAVVT